MPGQESARKFQGEIKDLQNVNDSDVIASDTRVECGGERKTSDECKAITEKSSSTKTDLNPEAQFNDRPAEEVLTEVEGRENTGQVDTSNKDITQKNELSDLTQANNNAEDIHVPCKRSIAMSILEKDPETGTESKLNDDCKERTGNFRLTISADNSSSKLEQTTKECPQEQDGKTQDQQKTITDSTMKIARNGPFNAASKMDSNIPLDKQKLELAPCCESDKPVEEADPKDSSIDTPRIHQIFSKRQFQKAFPMEETIRDQ